jgi:hypothetical protein
MGNLDKPRVAEIGLDLAQRRAMHTAPVQQKSRNAKTLRAPMTYQERSGNAEETSRLHETPN